MVIWEALKGAQVELQCTPASDRLRCAARLSLIFASELAGIASMAGFGLRAWRTYRSLPGCAVGAPGGAGGLSAVRVVRDIRYGERPRTVLDLYLPPARPGAPPGPGTPGAAAGGAPVALFCHGGVWASGEKWHYAPMAARLAQAGVLVGVISYTLYPQARTLNLHACRALAHAPQMATELSAALSWALDHVAEYGGDPNQARSCKQGVTALGHSAGAQLWFMALLGRARAARLRPKPSITPCSTGREDAAALYTDARMPARFVGMAGVYDIGEHYSYEAGRGVALLSTMARVVAGADYARDGAAPPPPEAFAAQSPARLLAAVAGVPLARQPELAGQALASRIGFDRAGALARCAPCRCSSPEQPSAAAPSASLPAAAAEPTGAAGLGSLEPSTRDTTSSGGRSGGQPDSLQRLDPNPGNLGSGLRSGAEQPADGGCVSVSAAGREGDGGAWELHAEAGAGAAGAGEPWARPGGRAAGVSGPAGVPQHAGGAQGEFTLADAARLPPCVLLSSCADVTVPWRAPAPEEALSRGRHESAEMFWRLADCGVPAAHLVYPRASHSDFVTAWRPLPAPRAGGANPNLNIDPDPGQPDTANSGQPIEARGAGAGDVNPVCNPNPNQSDGAGPRRPAPLPCAGEAGAASHEQGFAGTRAEAHLGAGQGVPGAAAGSLGGPVGPGPLAGGAHAGRCGSAGTAVRCAADERAPAPDLPAGLGLGCAAPDLPAGLGLGCEAPDLPDFAQDLVVVLTGRVRMAHNN